MKKKRLRDLKLRLPFKQLLKKMLRLSVLLSSRLHSTKRLQRLKKLDLPMRRKSKSVLKLRLKN